MILNLVFVQHERCEMETFIRVEIRVHGPVLVNEHELQMLRVQYKIIHVMMIMSSNIVEKRHKYDDVQSCVNDEYNNGMSIV